MSIETEAGNDVNGVDAKPLDADIVCVGFGPATGGFLTTLSRQIMNPDGTPALESPHRARNAAAGPLL